MQIQPDYSHQLEEIAKALNRSSIPQWMVALISALVGVFLGIAGQWLLKLIDNRRDIHKMRRVLYRDLLTMFTEVEYAMVSTDMPEAWRVERLRALLKFDGEAYLKGHQDVYTELPERGAFEVLYAVYHRISATLMTPYIHLDDKQLRQGSELAKGVLANLVEQNQLPRKYIKKFFGSAIADKLIKKLHGIYEEAKRRREARAETTESTDGK